MTFTIEFDAARARDSPLARFSWLRAAAAWADETGPVVREALKKEAPVGKGPRAGRLRDAIRYQRESRAGRVVLIFTSHTPYTPYVLHGTGPHLITAKAARALHWQGPDGDMFARSVHHPGTKPNPFPERAVGPIADGLREALAEAVRASMEGA